MALMIATVGLTGCQQTSTTARDHNSLFDFSQRPRFFGAGASQNPLPQLPQLSGNSNSLGTGLGSINNPLAGIGASPAASRTASNRPLASLFSGFGNQPSASGSRNPSLNSNAIATDSPQQYQQFSQIATQVNSLNQRVSAFDADNQLLNTEVAGLKQKLELANQYNQTLKEQLADTSGRIQQSEVERNNAIAQAERFKQQAQQIQQQSATINQGQFAQVSAQQPQPWQRQGDSQPQSDRFASSDSFNGQGRNQFASATIRANNSLMRRLNEIDIPGGEARMDGDVIRIEFPSDRMFVSGSYQIAPSQRPVLSDIVSTVRRSFPRQIIGVEAHWDNTPLNPPGTTDHQLTATQSLAVFEELIRLGLPERQMFTMAMASNRPRHPAGSFGGVSPNRRIELVIYPETYDGS